MEAERAPRTFGQELKVGLAACLGWLLQRLLTGLCRTRLVQPTYAQRRRRGEDVRCLYATWHGFLWHGSQKLLGFPIAAREGSPAFITWIAGPIELVGGLLVMVGLFTRPAAFLCSGLMAAAYWMAHGLTAPFPIENRGELAALYCFVFLLISAYGPGTWSLDRE